MALIHVIDHQARWRDPGADRRGAGPTEASQSDRKRLKALTRQAVWSGRRESNPHSQLGKTCDFFPIGQFETSDGAVGAPS